MSTLAINNTFKKNVKTCQSIVDCREEKRLLFFKNNFAIKECKTCTHRLCQPLDIENHVSNVYSDSYFFDGRDGYPNYLEERDILIKHGIHYAKIISKYVVAPGALLDVGCAAGFILKGFEQQGWTCHGLEPNKTMANYGANKFKLDIKVGDLESFEDDKRFDLITLIQVIGHFQDIDKAINNAYRQLYPGGYILVESWNRNRLISKLLGKNWHEYSPPSVIHWFSSKSLIDFFEFHGFKLVDKGLPLKQINLKHAISLISDKIPSSFLKQKIFNKVEKSIGKLNVIYPPMDLNWYIFQKTN